MAATDYAVRVDVNDEGVRALRRASKKLRRALKRRGRKREQRLLRCIAFLVGELAQRSIEVAT